MSLLLDFLCRFGWGLAAALVLTPVAVVPAGFFRVNLLVVLGLATFAALVARTTVAGPAWIVAVLAAVTAWLGSVLWLAARPRAGLACCAVASLLLAAATMLVQGRSGSTGAAFLAPLVSGLVSGTAVHAMLLGHWYLNAPGMSVAALRRMIDLALAAWGAQLLIAVWAAVPPAGGRLPVNATPLVLSLAALRWLAGLVGLPVLLVMARKTLDIPNTQSATGILYVASLAAILGELTGQLLQGSP
ncbi:MAG: hypothetical protein ACK6CT_00750 [Planctomycetia bacterium]